MVINFVHVVERPLIFVHINEPFACLVIIVIEKVEIAVKHKAFGNNIVISNKTF